MRNCPTTNAAVPLLKLQKVNNTDDARENHRQVTSTCPDVLIIVFLLFLFAREDEIGFDPTVHRIIDKDNKTRNIYEIDPEDVASEPKGKDIDQEPKQKTKQDTKRKRGKRFFKTIGVIYSPRYVCVSGRQTRVWRAIEVDGKTTAARDIGGAEVALKEVWIYEGSRSEFQTQELINKKLKALNPEDYSWASESLQGEIRNALSDFPKNLPLMQIECGGWGEVAKFRPVDAQLNKKILFPGEGSPTLTQSNWSVDPRSLQQDHTSTGISIFSGSTRSHELAVKRQYRLVYHQVGCSLYKAEDLSSSFTVIKDAFIALVLMFLAGWIHRDVSAGNIIVIRDANGRVSGRLSDLEYAREHDQVVEGVTDPKTGTPFFMPIEIHNGQHLFVQSRPLASEKTTDTMVPKSSSNAMPAFGAHHDLESLATWTSLWVVLCRVLHAPALTAAPLIFSNSSVPSPYRQNLFKGLSDCGTSRIEDGIHPELASLGFPSVVQEVTGTLLNACLSLSTIWDPTLRKKYYEALHNGIYTQVCELQRIAASAQAVTFIPSPEGNPPSVVPSLNVLTPTGKRSTEKINNNNKDHTDKKRGLKEEKNKTPPEQIKGGIRTSKKPKRSHEQPECIYSNE
ncbi:hypothetical protein NP233_g927 [Leucocoprinus birnbaumii]|uniref:Fungal-type protein kinase domain-containing protein n=1 Tax=Leucocoprinus birnbaumii TaxID=56174 RepID=A0AAD5W3F5_9AGAR|nr:hypothetical protein NP233_g927 [Leucocoprinus birnbaumii]